MKDQSEEKEKILELLKTTPIVGTACARAGMARATFYRWLDEDPTFGRRVREAMKAGNRDMNDLAYGKLLLKIEANSLPAIIYYLSRRHPYFKRPDGMKHRVQIVESRKPRRLGDVPDLAFRDIVIKKLTKKLRKRVRKDGMALYAALQAAENELAREHPEYWKRVRPRTIPWGDILKGILEQGDK